MRLHNLKTGCIGKNFIFHNTIDSTQKEIWRLINNEKIINGTLVMANIQTQGIGTHGRIWHTDERGNIAFSFYIETNCSVCKLNGITIDIAKILVDILKDNYSIQLQIKAPNDLVYNNKKIGGILTESKISSEIVKYLVIGIGMNISKMDFSNDIKTIATSIKKEFNIEINEFDIISEFCNRFEKFMIDKNIIRN